MVPNSKELSRRHFLYLMATATAAGALALAGCDVKTTPPTPFADNEPYYPPTPVYIDTKLAPALSIYSRLNNPEFVSTLSQIDSAIPDPLVRSRVLEVLVDNYIATQTDGMVTRQLILRDSGRQVGFNLCGDSRIICKTAYWVTDPGVEDLYGKKILMGVAEQRSLGAAPQVFENGIDISILATHCNSLTDLNGCGALAGLAKLKEANGYTYLQYHGIADDTIQEIMTKLSSANPEEQAVIAAKIQAMINANAHGTSHITVATVIAQDTSEWKILGAFDETGKAVQVPELANDIVSFNRAPVSQVEAFLARGQRPFEIVLNATTLNTQDLMGPVAAEPGHTFKITAQPQSGNKLLPLNIAEVDTAIAGVNYPLAHLDWSKVQWVIARNPEELALIRDRLFRSTKLQDFLGKGGYLVEGIVDDQGKLSKVLRVTSLAKYPEEVAQSTAALNKLAVNSVEIKISQKMITEAQQAVAEMEVAGNVQAGKNKAVVEQLKKLGKIGIRLMKALQPVFDAGTYMWMADIYQSLLNMNVIYDDHNPRKIQYFDASTGQWAERLDYGLEDLGLGYEIGDWNRLHPNVDAHMGLGNFRTEYAQAELAKKFVGLVNLYIADLDAQKNNPLLPEIGTMYSGSKDPSSQFFEIPIDQLWKVLCFDYSDGMGHYIFSKKNPPLLFQPLSVKTDYSPDHIDYRLKRLKDYQFMILNPETGEYLVTGIEGEMIVPVVAKQPINDVEVEYDMLLRTDSEGNLHVTCVGYKENPSLISLAQKLFAAVGVTISNTIPDPVHSEVIFQG